MPFFNQIQFAAVIQFVFIKGLVNRRQFVVQFVQGFLAGAVVADLLCIRDVFFDSSGSGFQSAAAFQRAFSGSSLLNTCYHLVQIPIGNARTRRPGQGFYSG
jgi:hypothetical protein